MSWASPTGCQTSTCASGEKRGSGDLEPQLGDYGLSRPQAKVVLEPGSVLILYSDGLNRLMTVGVSLTNLPLADVRHQLITMLDVKSDLERFKELVETRGGAESGDRQGQQAR